MREDPDGNHTRNLIEMILHLDRIWNAEIADVEYVVAVVGNESFAPDWTSASLD